MRRVLWVEDEPEQVTAARKWLGKRGWLVAVERDIIEAARRFATEEFHGVIMDLMLPGGLDNAAAGYRIWATYRLQCWLGGVATSGQTNVKAGLSEQWPAIDQLRPLEVNIRIPAMVVSAYHDRDVADAMEVVHNLRTGRSILLCSKPIDAALVPEHLERITAPQ